MIELRFLANLETGEVRITNQHGVELSPPGALRLYEPTAEELRPAAESLAACDRQRHHTGPMPEPIKPALSAEGWEYPSGALHGYINIDEGVVDVRLVGTWGECDPVAGMRALIALLNASLPDARW